MPLRASACCFSKREDRRSRNTLSQTAADDRAVSIGPPKPVLRCLVRQIREATLSPSSSAALVELAGPGNLSFLASCTASEINLQAVTQQPSLVRPPILGRRSA